MPDQEIRQRYVSHYSNAVGAFIQDVGEIDASGIPEPHLPLWGSTYETAKLRTAFIGRDASCWGGMPFFLESARNDIQTVVPLKMRENEFRANFMLWTNNFGSSFWDTAREHLAAIYRIAEWKTLEGEKNNEIFQSLVWANANSVELWSAAAVKRWEAKASKAAKAPKKANFESWTLLKAASERHLDSFPAILEVFRPHLAIVMNWKISPIYWGSARKWEALGDHVNYTRDESYGTHVFHTAHPTWLSRKKMRRAVFDVIHTKWSALQAGN
jgi:hypothetical protein